MKKYLLAILLFLPFITNAQPIPQPPYGFERALNSFAGSLSVKGPIILPRMQSATNVVGVNSDLFVRDSIVMLRDPFTGNISAIATAATGAFQGTLAAARLKADGYSTVVTTDFGGGTWYYNSSDVTTPDNTATIFVTSTGKRYYRIYQGAVNVMWGGAKADSTTNDSAAIASIINSFSDVYFPRGYYKANIMVPQSGKHLVFESSSYDGSKLVGAVIVGGITITGNNNAIVNAGVINTSGNGVVIRGSASFNMLKGCNFKIQNHGVLMEQYGGSATGNMAIECTAYGGIHGFVSKTQDALFLSCRAMGVQGTTQDGVALVSDNITGLGFNSICQNNRVINCVVKNTNTGISIYSRDYTSTTNTAGIALQGISIVGCLLDSMTAYGILVGDANAPPGGQTFNDVLNISIDNTNISNVGPSAINFDRCNTVAVNNCNAGGLYTKTSNAKNVKILNINTLGASLGNVVYNTVLTVNSTTPTVQNGDVYYETANTGSTIISNFLNGKVGKVITVMINDPVTIIAKSANLNIKEYIRGAGSYVTLKFRNDASGWDEISSYSVIVNQDWPYAAVYNINLDYGKYATTQVTGNVDSINFLNPVKTGRIFTLQLYSTAAYAIANWDSRIIWANSQAAPTATVANSRMVFQFYYDGTNLINTYRNDNQGILASKGSVPSGSDLNNYKLTGIFFQTAGSTGLSNTPYQGLGVLMVSTDNARVYQTFQSSILDSSMYFRSYNTGYWTDWRKVGTTLSATATLDFGSISANAQLAAPSTVSLPGAVIGDVVTVIQTSDPVCYKAIVTAPGTLTVYGQGFTGSAFDPPNQTFKFIILR